MSANNQTLIKKHKGKYLVFSNVNAESWDEVNILPKAQGLECDTFEDAYEQAEAIEQDDYTEYGIHRDRLFKDGAEVVIE
jgi:hypothetical protein